jgi:MinD-like ATPase involved in chromosome partitioning or flagellar assembly
MAVPVLTAVTGAVWEAELVSELDRADHGVTVVRRCVDLADLLAAAAAGTARAALLSADLRRLDRDAVARLAAASVAVVGLINPDDEDAERRLRQLGVLYVLPADAGAEAISAAVLEAVETATDGTARQVIANPQAAAALGERPVESAEPESVGPGRVIAVWGPTGAPGRTTVAVGLADEAARLGVPTLLVDADVYGGVIAQVLGLLDESPGVAAATRQAAAGTLDVPALARVALSLGPSLRVLTGIARADRWPELRPSSIDVVLDLARRLCPLTVVDCAFSIEQDEEIVYDTMAPRRNGATIATLEAADQVLCVCSADPVGLQRAVRALSELRDVLPDVTPQVVVNRTRRGVIPGDARREVAGALARYAGVAQPHFLPADTAATDAALRVGKTLAEAAPGSSLRSALTELAESLVGAPVGRRR